MARRIDYRTPKTLAARLPAYAASDALPGCAFGSFGL
jgi:hypothetical protein